MMLISVSLGFLVSYLVFLIPSFVKNKANLFAYLIFIAVVCTSTIYTSRYMDGTGWIGPYTKYWRAQGHPIEPSDYIITPSMKEIAGFAKSAEKTDLQPYRFFIFPLMPTQIQFFRYNLPLISGDSIGSFDSEKLYSEYIDKVNDLILSGDNRSAVSLSPLRGKYIAIIDDVNSSAYKGVPSKWLGTKGALTGDPNLFEETISKISGFVRSVEKNNIFVNTYTSLPLLSYVDNAILVKGNLNDLFDLYAYVIPKNNTTLVPIFADQISPKEISSLLSSGIVRTVLHNSTKTKSLAETDLYLLSQKSIKSKYHFNQ